MSPAEAPISTEQGPQMWARVKGKTENDLLKLPFKAAYMFRPAGIQPLHGVRIQDRLGSGDLRRGRAAVVLAQSRRAEIHEPPASKLGRAMIKVARDGFPKPVLESEDINRV